jgi:hypothetical protein
MQPSRRLHRRPEPSVVTIQPGLAFSDTCLQVGESHYTFRAMAGVHTRQGRHDPLTKRAGWLTGIGALLLGLFAGRMHLAGLLAGLGLLTALAALALVSAHRRPRRLELWVDYDDKLTLLFVSTDHWAFHAVDRHLRRILVELRMASFGSISQAGRPNRYAETDRQPGRGRSRHEHLLGKVAPTYVNVPHPSNMHPSTMRPDGGAGWQRAA